MANRALQAKADRAMGQRLEAGHMEGTKSCYLQGNKQRLRDELARLLATQKELPRIKTVETYRQGDGKLARPVNYQAKRGNADMRARKDLIVSGGVDVRALKQERRERPVIKWATGSVLYRGGQRVG